MPDIDLTIYSYGLLRVRFSGERRNVVAKFLLILNFKPDGFKVQYFPNVLLNNKLGQIKYLCKKKKNLQDV